MARPLTDQERKNLFQDDAGSLCGCGRPVKSCISVGDALLTGLAIDKSDLFDAVYTMLMTGELSRIDATHVPGDDCTSRITDALWAEATA